MGVELKYLIIEQSYLFQIGISSILQKLGETNIIRYNRISDIEKKIQNHNPDVLIINEKLYSEEKLIIDKYQNKIEYAIIILSNNQTHKNDSSTIYYNDNKELIVNKLMALIPKLISKEDNSILSKREQNILREISLGYSNKEIAEKLFISIHTVMTHRKNITHKLRIKSVAGLTVYAILNNIVSPNEVN